MAAAFYPVTQKEMEDFLLPLGFQKMSLPRTSELVYGKVVRLDDLKLSLRVYSGINPNGVSRDVGKDAIRVALYWKRPDGEVVQACGDKRVHRVTNWEKNLAERIDTALTRIEKICPECGAPMIRRKRKSDKHEFLGCTNFSRSSDNNCKHTEAI